MGSLGSGGSALSEMDCSGLVGVTINQDENNLIREMQREINEKNEEIADLRARSFELEYGIIHLERQLESLTNI